MSGLICSLNTCSCAVMFSEAIWLWVSCVAFYDHNVVQVLSTTKDCLGWRSYWTWGLCWCAGSLLQQKAIWMSRVFAVAGIMLVFVIFGASECLVWLHGSTAERRHVHGLCSHQESWRCPLSELQLTIKNKNYFSCHINDWRCTTAKEEHGQLLWQTNPSCLTIPFKSNSLKQKPSKRSFQNSNRDTEV